MTDLSDFRRRVYEPLVTKHRLAVQDVEGVCRVFDELAVPEYRGDEKLRPTGRARELAAEVKRLRDALAEARPYVFQRVFPLGHEMRDWRSETAESILARVDAALGKGETT